MINSDARALQNLLKMQIFDLLRSTLKLRVGHKISSRHLSKPTLS